MQSVIATRSVVVHFYFIANAIEVGIDAFGKMSDRTPASFAEAGGRDDARWKSSAGSLPEDPESSDRRFGIGQGGTTTVSQVSSDRGGTTPVGCMHHGT